MTRFKIAIDRDQDGRFARDISDHVLALEWRLGMRAPYDSMAEAGWARITVRNPRGEFSPERRPLQSGTRARIQSSAAGVTRTQFIGAISHIDPDEGEYSDKQAVIHLIDILPWLAASPAQLPPQTDVTAGPVIGKLLDQSAICRAVVAGFCIIDVAGYNQIDSARIFPPQNHPRRLAAGKTRFAHIGDWWTEATSAREAIAEIAASERGRFYLDRAGSAVFLDRHYTLIHTEVAARFDDDMLGMDYRYGAQRLNCIALRITPREIGEDDSLLWRLRAPLRIAPDSELTLTLRLVDERDQPIGLLAFDRLVVRFQDPGSRHEIHERARAEVLQLATSSLQVLVSNSARAAVNLARLEVYGRPLYRRDPLEISAADGEGMHLYGRRQLTLDLPALSDIASATAFARYELARRKHPRGVIREIRLDARQHREAALSHSLFDRIRVSEAQTGHSARDYFIIAEEHQVSAGGTRHTVRWTLEPADSKSPLRHHQQQPHRQRRRSARAPPTTSPSNLQYPHSTAWQWGTTHRVAKSVLAIEPLPLASLPYLHRGRGVPTCDAVRRPSGEEYVVMLSAPMTIPVPQ